MTRVSAPTRLHFGLLRVPPSNDIESSLPRFGGLGLMLDGPRVLVRVERAETWASWGPSAARAEAFARRVAPAQTALDVTVEQCPEEHTGLGVGTALGMAVAEAVTRELGRDELPAVTLAKSVGRGARSAIGVHGFRSGGFMIDGGKAPGDAIGSLLAAVTFPRWPVLVVMPRTAGSWSGDAERGAFARPRITGDCDRLAAELTRMATEVIRPAILDSDYDQFGDALYDYNRRAGEPFAADQGGAYASPGIAAAIARLRSLGVHGAGQSSWGPTVFGICKSATQAETVASALTAEGLAVTVTRADNVGRVVTSE
jgi:beta-ribofuranosylaminobenzene 5'-phosphate synthase